MERYEDTNQFAQPATYVNADALLTPAQIIATAQDALQRELEEHAVELAEMLDDTDMPGELGLNIYGRQS